MISGHEVMVPTDKKCKRCNGRGIGQWGSIYGECYRCGGSGVEYKSDVAATMAGFIKTLERIKAEGEAAKAKLALGGDVLTVGNARRALEFARRQYKEVLIERQRYATLKKVKTDA